MVLENKFKVAITLLFTILSFSFASFAQSGGKFVVILDAGHGGKDTGAKYNGNQEKDITLAIILKVGKILEQNTSINLIYTRKTDEFIELRERAKIANRANANLFVSVHCNANRNSVANGSETYVMGMSRANMNLEVSKAENSVIFLEDNYKKAYKGFDPNNPETLIGLKIVQENNLTSSIDLATKIQNNFLNDNRKSRGVKQEPIWVLDATTMPGVLIETGFISSPLDVEVLESESGQQQIAESIAKAIVSYKDEYYGNGELDVNEVKPSHKIIETPVIVPKDTPPVIKPKPVDAPNQPNKQTTKKDTIGIIYKVQLAASIKKLALEPRNFKGLKNISMSYDNKVYKYMSGETKDYILALKNLQEAKKKGYDSAFLIAFRHGQKISMEEAQK
jgi:N-acetylmuramoyl-L-alanine amidase